MAIEKTLSGVAPRRSAGPLPGGLRVSFSTMDGRTFPVTRNIASVGRKEGDLIFNHPTVSSNHAVLEHADTGFVLRDLGSTNGTFVNGERIAAKVIDNLDEVRFGEFVLTFNVVEDRYGMHDSEPTLEHDANTTLMIASAPSVAMIPDNLEVLLFCETGGAERQIRLQKRLSTVGRAEGDVVVDDQTLSRKHFQVEVHPDHLAVKDLGSVNGTHIGGKPVSYTRLQPGQSFSAGRTKFRIEIKK